MKTAYLASSYGNDSHQLVINSLTNRGYTVYDYRTSGNFHLRDYPEATQADMKSPQARQKLIMNIHAIRGCDLFVLLTPAGASSHAELGYAAALAKPILIVQMAESRPELMYALADIIWNNTLSDCTLAEAIDAIEHKADIL